MPLAAVKVNPAGAVMKTETGSTADAASPLAALVPASSEAKITMVSPSDASILKTVVGRPIFVVPEGETNSP